MQYREFYCGQDIGQHKQHYLLKHAFTKDVLIHANEYFISYFIVDIEITNVVINRDFPLIVNHDEVTKTNMNVNECIHMLADIMKLGDLVKYQHVIV